MPKSKDINDSTSVTAHIQQMPPALGEIVEAIRQLILQTDPIIGEQIKWNSPSFFYHGEMKTFAAKEYKRDIVVMNVHKGYPLLVFPTGAKIHDTTGLLEGDYTDGRRLAKFQNIEEVQEKGKDLQKVIQNWLDLVEIPE